MIRSDELTPRQRRIGRRAARFPKLRPAYLMINAVCFLLGALYALRGYRLLGQEPAGAWEALGVAGVVLSVSAIALSLGPTIDLLGLLYRELEGSGSLGATGDAPPSLEAARGGLAPAEGRLVASARQLERLGWGAIRGALLVVLVSGLAVVAAALWRFGSEDGGLGTAALAMAASGGLTLGVALGGLALLRWMRLAARLGVPVPEREAPR